MEISFFDVTNRLKDWSKAIWPFPKSFWTYRKMRHNLRTVNWNVFVSFDKSRIWKSLILPILNYPSLIWTNQKNLFSLELWIPETNALYFNRIRNHFGKFHNNLDWSKTIWPFPKSFLAYRKTRHYLLTVNWNIFVSFDKINDDADEINDDAR